MKHTSSAIRLANISVKSCSNSKKKPDIFIITVSYTHLPVQQIVGRLDEAVRGAGEMCIRDRLRTQGFGYVKIDYNENIGVGCDGAESLGEGLRQRVAASQAFFRAMAEAMPELVIENCSSGGHRLEPSMMELVSQASFSDAHECLSIPIIAANLHRVIRPEQSQIWAVLHAKDTPARIHYLLAAACLGRMCLSGDIFALDQDQWSEVQKGIAFYGQAKEIIRDGYTERRECTASSYNQPTGWQGVLRTLGDRALLVVHTLSLIHI